MLFSFKILSQNISVILLKCWKIYFFRTFFLSIFYNFLRKLHFTDFYVKFDRERKQIFPDFSINRRNLSQNMLCNFKILANNISEIIIVIYKDFAPFSVLFLFFDPKFAFREKKNQNKPPMLYYFYVNSYQKSTKYR